jgi:hypothetical protein
MDAISLMTLLRCCASPNPLALDFLLYETFMPLTVYAKRIRPQNVLLLTAEHTPFLHKVKSKSIQQFSRRPWIIDAI